MKTVNFKKLSTNAVTPTRATEGSVGYDLYVPADTKIPAMSRVVIPTDIAIELPIGYEAQIRPRSGYSLKGIEGVSVGADNGKTRRFNADVLIGTVDADFRNGIGVIIKNVDAAFIIKGGTRIAQMVINRVELPELIEVEELSDTARGLGGFGSTGK